MAALVTCRIKVVAWLDQVGSKVLTRTPLKIDSKTMVLHQRVDYFEVQEAMIQS